HELPQVVDPGKKNVKTRDEPRGGGEGAVRVAHEPFVSLVGDWLQISGDLAQVVDCGGNRIRPAVVELADVARVVRWVVVGRTLGARRYWAWGVDWGDDACSSGNSCRGLG